MRNRFLSRLAQGAVVMALCAGSVWSGKAIAGSQAGTCLPDAGHEDGPECWWLVYIHGEPGDPMYESYAAKYGRNHGCTHLSVTDDSANPVDPYIFSTELCLLTTADQQSAYDLITFELIGMTPATVIQFPVAQ